MFDRFCLRALLLGGVLLPLASCSTTSLTTIVISPTTFTTTLALSSNGDALPPSQQMWTQYTAMGYYGHAGHQTTRDITKEVTWISYTPLLVTVSSTGVATVSGQATGFSQITAMEPGFNGDIMSNASTFTVNLPSSVSTSDVTSLAITPNPATIAAVGKTLGLVAIGTTGTGQTENLSTAVTWTSSTPGVATIGQSTGLVTAVSVGSTVITATYTNADGLKVTATTSLTVQ
jgi:hypothetical protein